MQSYKVYLLKSRVQIPSDQPLRFDVWSYVELNKREAQTKQLKDKETQRKNRGQVYSSPSVCLLTETNKSDGKGFSKQQISMAINQSRGFHDLKNF